MTSELSGNASNGTPASNLPHETRVVAPSGVRPRTRPRKIRYGAVALPTSHTEGECYTFSFHHASRPVGRSANQSLPCTRRTAICWDGKNLVVCNKKKVWNPTKN